MLKTRPPDRLVENNRIRCRPPLGDTGQYPYHCLYVLKAHSPILPVTIQCRSMDKARVAVNLISALEDVLVYHIGTHNPDGLMNIMPLHLSLIHI